MILYFTGTGNSRYVAEKIGEITGDTVKSVVEFIKKRKRVRFTSQRPFVFVCPTYAWRIPTVFEKFIKLCSFEGNDKAYFVMTCGENIGNADHYLKILCEECNFEYMGVAQIVMPENYTAMFPVPDKKEADEIIQNAAPYISKAAMVICNGEYLVPPKNRVTDEIESRLINPLFYKLFVTAKGFRTTDSCVLCGKCEELCPLNNIRLVDNKVKWGNQCTHCMACINACPMEAIEYKNKSVGKERYYLKK